MYILPRLAFYITKTDIIPNPLLHIGCHFDSGHGAWRAASIPLQLCFS